MSDSDDFMMEEDQDFDFEYESGEQEDDEGDVDLENMYYSAKGLKDDAPEEALVEFRGVVAAQETPSDWYSCFEYSSYT